MEKFSLQTKHSRRKFLAGAGAVGAATLAAGCGDSTPAAPAPTPTPTPTPVTPALNDNDVLNFALNLEYLEAEFYLRAATGSGLATGDQGGSPGTVTGGAMVTGLTAPQQQILNEIAYDEQSHVQYLRKALGSAAVSRPTIDFSKSFAALATAAGITGAAFDPFSNFDSFLVGAFIFEDVGVTAYHGAAGLISSAGIQAGLLGAAASIMAVESYHAAYVRTALTARAINAAAATPATAYPYVGYANAISKLRASVGNGKETPLVVPTSPSTPSSIVAADSNAIAYARTTDEVLHIVYGTGGGAGVKSGAFFPNGLNGTIFTTKS